MNKILACLDASDYAPSVVDMASWIASRSGASVELLHVVQRDDAVAARHDLSGAVGLGAKSKLLEELAALDEQRTRLQREQGQEILREAGLRLAESGIDEVTSTHRHGGVLETIIEREAEAELVLIGKRGESSEYAKGHLGSQVERVIRESDRPVLVVHREPREVKRAFLCFDDGDTAWRAVDFAANSPVMKGVELTVAMSGHKKAANQGVLERVQERLPNATVRHIEGVPDSVLPPAWQAIETDLVLMGAYGHSPLRRWIIGSTTTMLLRTAKVPVLVFR
ncbi:MAG: universal stress protein [Planctomycetota bacterium]